MLHTNKTNKAIQITQPNLENVKPNDEAIQMSSWAVDVREAYGSILLEEEACVTVMTLISNLESGGLWPL